MADTLISDVSFQRLLRTFYGFDTIVAPDVIIPAALPTYSTRLTIDKCMRFPDVGVFIREDKPSYDGRGRRIVGSRTDHVHQSSKSAPENKYLLILIDQFKSKYALPILNWTIILSSTSKF